MTETEFYNRVKNSILNYLPQDFENSSVMLQDVMKNNDKKLTGLAVLREGHSLSPVVYLEQFYEAHQNGEPFAEVCGKIADMYMDSLHKGRIYESMDMSYEGIRDKLRLKVVNTKNNKEVLKNVVSHNAECGFSLVPYIDLPSDSSDGAMIQITKDLAEQFDYDPEEIIKDATVGTWQHDPPMLCKIEDMLFSYIGGAPTNYYGAEKPVDDIGSFMVLTSPSGMYGSIELFMPGVQEEIAKTVGGSYYVLPSSVHEVLIMPETDRFSKQELAEMVQEVNRMQVAPEDQLGNKVLRYNADMHWLTTAVDLDKAKAHVSER